MYLHVDRKVLHQCTSPLSQMPALRAKAGNSQLTLVWRSWRQVGHPFSWTASLRIRVCHPALPPSNPLFILRMRVRLLELGMPPSCCKVIGLEPRRPRQAAQVFTGCAGIFHEPLTACVRMECCVNGAQRTLAQAARQALPSNRGRALRERWHQTLPSHTPLTQWNVAVDMLACRRTTDHERERQDPRLGAARWHATRQASPPVLTHAQAASTEPPAKSLAVILGNLGKCILGNPMSMPMPMFIEGNCSTPCHAPGRTASRGGRARPGSRAAASTAHSGARVGYAP